MRTFKLKADIQFQAEDIDSALRKLGEHFFTLSGDWMDGELDFVGSVDIGPIEEEKDK